MLLRRTFPRASRAEYFTSAVTRGERKRIVISERLIHNRLLQHS